MDMAVSRDRNGNKRYHFGPGTETVRDRNGHRPIDDTQYESCGLWSNVRSISIKIDLTVVTARYAANNLI